MLLRPRKTFLVTIGVIVVTVSVFVFGPTLMEALNTSPDRVQYRCTPDATKGRHDPVRDPRPSGTLKVIHLTNAGEFVDRCELSDALYDLNWDRAYSRRRPPVKSDAKSLSKLAVLYVHGWRHDGEPDDGDVQAFRALLEKLRDRYAGKKNVVGIYVAWNALSGFGVLDYLTFWSKKAVADRIAQSAVVTKIVSSVGAMMDRATDNPDQFIAIGHSLGARMLFAATAQSLIMATENAHPGYDTGTYKLVRGAADIVVLLNPAFEATMYTAVNDFMRNEEFFRPDQLPLIVTISTTDDWVTKTAFPIGQWLSSARSPRETTAVGNYDAYITHTLLPAKDGKCRANDADMTETYLMDGLCLRRSDHQVGRIVQTHNPFLVVRTVPSVIRGHGGIWSAAFSTWLFDALSSLVQKRDDQGLTTPAKLKLEPEVLGRAVSPGAALGSAAH